MEPEARRLNIGAEMITNIMALVTGLGFRV